MVWYIKTNLRNWTIQVKLKFQSPINILVPVFYFLGMAEVPHRNAVLLSTTILFHKINMLLKKEMYHNYIWNILCQRKGGENFLNIFSLPFIILYIPILIVKMGTTWPPIRSTCDFNHLFSNRKIFKVPTNCLLPILPVFGEFKHM